MLRNNRRWIAVSSCAVWALAATSAASAATLPPGFFETSIGGLSSPTAMDIAPDGRIFVCQQGGALRVIKNGALLATPFVTLTVNSDGERGLLGVAFDPNFATNQFVYVYYTATTPAIHNRISRFTASGDVAVGGSEVVLFDLDNLSGATNHNGGAIHFGADGKLYAAVGENANSANAQSFANVLGKVLRINSDGSIPSDNPFFGVTAGNNRAIWALGLRNPFTFAFQPGTGRMFINDVGEGTWEEINDGIAGSNYGWPQTEGPNPPGTAGVRYPLFSYIHDGSTCAIAGGSFYNPPTAQFPASYVGKYFFADLCAGWIHRFNPANGAVVDFATGISAPVDLKIGADGSLYYLARNSGAVFRVRYSAAVTASVFRPSESSWYLRNSNSQGFNDLPPIGYGASGDMPVAGDWNGDGIDTIGVYRPTQQAWYLRNSNSHGFNDVPVIFFGAPGDIPVVGDWNGDGVDSIGVYRPSQRAWFLRNSNTQGPPDIVLFYGAAGDIPVVGDWNGDGVDTIGVYRPSQHAWYLRNANTQGPNDVPVIVYGIDGDIPVVGDWNGDLSDTIGVLRPADFSWFLRNSNTQGVNDVPSFNYGAVGDIPVTGNWDGLPVRP